MLLALAVPPVSVLLLDFKVVVGAVVVEYAVVPFAQEMAVFVDLGLYEVAFIAQYIECAVDIVKAVRRALEKLGGCGI